MWIHLHHGDAGLQRFLKRVCALCDHLLIEPQPWKCYRSCVKRWRKRKLDAPPAFKTLTWRDDVDERIVAYLQSDCGFSLRKVPKLCSGAGKPLNRLAVFAVAWGDKMGAQSRLAFAFAHARGGKIVDKRSRFFKQRGQLSFARRGAFSSVHVRCALILCIADASRSSLNTSPRVSNGKFAEQNAKYSQQRSVNGMCKNQRTNAPQFNHHRAPQRPDALCVLRGSSRRESPAVCVAATQQRTISLLRDHA